MKVYITRYALTTGVNIAEVEKISEYPHMVRCDRKYLLSRYYHKPHWHETPEEAAARVAEMKASRIKSLHRALKKIEALDPPGVVAAAKAV